MASGVEKWQWKLYRMANQYCIYAQWGDSIAHLPAQQDFHRCIPVDFWAKIMNISLFRATQTEQSIVMVENSVSWKALLNNYHPSHTLSTASTSKCLLTKTNLVHWPSVSSNLCVFVHYVDMDFAFFRTTFPVSKILLLIFILGHFMKWDFLKLVFSPLTFTEKWNLNRYSD